jgi:pilus assembly protein Flp/PilA
MKSQFARIIGTVVSVRERGATAVEYGIMVALIAAVIIVTVTSLGTSLNAAFTKISVKL